MSKSVGNFTSLSDLLSREDGRAYRLLVLQSHYARHRGDGRNTIARARVSLERLDLLAQRFPAAFAPGRPSAVDASGQLERFRTAMDDDLDTPGAISVLFETLRQANAAADAGRVGEADVLAAAVSAMADAVGLPARSPGAESLPAEVVDLVAGLDAARPEGLCNR